MRGCHDWWGIKIQDQEISAVPISEPTMCDSDECCTKEIIINKLTCTCTVM